MHVFTVLVMKSTSVATFHIRAVMCQPSGDMSLCVVGDVMIEIPIMPQPLLFMFCTQV